MRSIMANHFISALSRLMAERDIVEFIIRVWDQPVEQPEFVQDS